MLLAGGGYVLLFFWRTTAPVLVVGIVATMFGMLFLAPAAIRALAALARRAPISIRLALRDLVRYQARSGAALGAITLAIGIAATIAVADSSKQATADAAAPNGNLRDTELIVYLGHDAIAPDPGHVGDGLGCRADQRAADRHRDRHIVVDHVAGGHRRRRSHTPTARR